MGIAQIAKRALFEGLYDSNSKKSTPNQRWTPSIQTKVNKIYHSLYISLCPGAEVMLARKKVNNPLDFFDKTFAEYQQGFSENGRLTQKSIFKI